MSIELDGTLGVSKVQDSVIQEIMPSGAISFFARNTAPNGWLKANGAVISRTTYSALFAAIGTTFGVGDGSTTFNLPDLRGEFMRGYDDGRGADSGRTFGSTQTDSLKSHNHIFPYTMGAQSSGWGAVYSVSTTTSYDQPYTHTLNDGSAETRPRNVALLACIKY